MKKKALVDVPVLLIFFIRPDTFKLVFEKVREARPSKLFLACDGPRKGRLDDIQKINECKKIASEIDWECEVYTDYSEENMGCGLRPYSAINWAFSFVDELVIIEDDCVVETTLFMYQKELLEKYKNDWRVGAVSGFNHFKEWDCGKYSYFYTKTGATLAWGTWKRVWELYNYTLNGGINSYYQKMIYNDFRSKRVAKIRIQEWNNIENELRSSGTLDYWDLQYGFVKFTQSLLTIVPKHNMVCNVGIGEDSTHAKGQTQRKWKMGDILMMPTKKMNFPIVHQEYMICDHKYDIKYYKEMKSPNFFKRLNRKIRRNLRNFLYWRAK